MSDWVEYEPGQDVTGKVVRVIDGGRIVVQGLAQDAGPAPAPQRIQETRGPGWRGIALVPDADVDELDELARHHARESLAHSVGHVAQGWPVAVVFGWGPDGVLLVQA